MKTMISWIFLGLILGGCSSTSEDRKLEDQEHEEIQKDFSVVDASSKVRQGWIEDAEIWSSQNGKDIKKNRFFSYETGPKVSRDIACNLAKANARANIAGEISTFINKELTQTQEGVAGIDENDPEVQGLREYVDNILSEKIQAYINGASVSKTYWEKRKYQVDLGAKRDFMAYTCAIYIRMPKKRLEAALDRASRLVLEQVKDQTLKAKVEKKLQELPEKFGQKAQGLFK